MYGPVPSGVTGYLKEIVLHRSHWTIRVAVGLTYTISVIHQQFHHITLNYCTCNSISIKPLLYPIYPQLSPFTQQSSSQRLPLTTIQPLLSNCHGSAGQARPSPPVSSQLLPCTSLTPAPTTITTITLAPSLLNSHSTSINSQPPSHKHHHLISNRFLNHHTGTTSDTVTPNRPNSLLPPPPHPWHRPFPQHRLVTTKTLSTEPRVPP